MQLNEFNIQVWPLCFVFWSTDKFPPKSHCFLSLFFLFSQEKLSPFCDVIREEPFTLTCSVGRKSVALCNLHQYSTDLDPKYQVQ